MSVEIDKVDINEVFDDILFAEEKARETGFEEGYSTGENHLLKGYHLGYHRAGIISTQLGYYSGVIDYILNSRNSFSLKIIDQAKKLQEHIDQFPKINDDKVDILQLSEDIKFKFIKLCSLAKINYPQREVVKLNF